MEIFNIKGIESHIALFENIYIAMTFLICAKVMFYIYKYAQPTEYNETNNTFFLYALCLSFLMVLTSPSFFYNTGAEEVKSFNAMETVISYSFLLAFNFFINWLKKTVHKTKNKHLKFENQEEILKHLEKSNEKEKIEFLTEKREEILKNFPEMENNPLLKVKANNLKTIEN